MKKYFGVGVSDGYAIGNATLKKMSKLQVEYRNIEKHQVDEELQRFKQSVNQTIEELDHIIKNYTFAEDDKNILKSHKMILQDPELDNNITNFVANELMGVETAIFEHFKNTVDFFSQMENDFFSQRASDYEDVGNRLLNNTLGLKDDYEDQIGENSILIVDDIKPSKVAKLHHTKFIQGLVTEKGSKTSHSSIIARALGIPTVVGVKNISKEISLNDKIIVDGYLGEVYINPDKSTLDSYKDKIKQEKVLNEKLDKVRDLDTTTLDGTQLGLINNIEIPEEVTSIVEDHSDGIGLFRTEFLYIDRDQFPDEEEQYDIYNKIASRISPKNLIIRTIDLGGDKLSKVLNFSPEENPYLGLRGIRLSLKHEDIFKTQLRAVLRASVNKNIKIMFPMVSSLDELRRAKSLVKTVMNELDGKKIEFDDEIDIGVMIEVPSAVLIADELAKEADFFSIGTNDLVQYTLAVDRNSELVQDYYEPLHPAVLRLIDITVQNAHKHNIEVSVCGESAADPTMIPLLIGLGVDTFSVNVSSTLKTKKRILECSKKQCEQLTKKILKMKTVKSIKEALERSENEH